MRIIRVRPPQPRRVRRHKSYRRQSLRRRHTLDRTCRHPITITLAIMDRGSISLLRRSVTGTEDFMGGGTEGSMGEAMGDGLGEDIGAS